MYDVVDGTVTGTSCVAESFAVEEERWIWEHEELVNDERLPKVG